MSVMPGCVISVVMSVYNGERYLVEAVESILGQTYRDFEFIIIDDGSRDKTAGILEEFAKRDERVSVITQENKGRAESLNTGIKLAQGKYIARMDADDVAFPGRLKAQVEFMELHQDVGVLGGSFEIINREGKTLRVVQSPTEDSEIRPLLLRSNPMCHPAILMRKEVVVACGGYRKIFLDADDYDLWLRMSERASLANLDMLVLRYRVHPWQVSLNNMRHQTLCVLAARAAAEFRKQNRPDPLSSASEVNLELLKGLGVQQKQIEATIHGTYGYWVSLVEPTDPEAALSAIDGFANSPDRTPSERRAVADAHLKAASIHYQQGRPLRAFLSGVRGVLARPVVAGRPFKRALTRLAATLKGWS